MLKTTEDCRRLQKTRLNINSYLGRLPEFGVGSPKEMTPYAESPGAVFKGQRTVAEYVSLVCRSQGLDAFSFFVSDYFYISWD